MASNEPMDPAEFQRKLRQYQDAIKSEFDAVDAGDNDKVLALVKKKFAAAALVMADDLVMLAKSAQSEATQLSAIKYAYEFIFGKDGSKDSDFNELLRALTETPSDE